MAKNHITKINKYFLLIVLLFLFNSCAENKSIINNVEEKEANEIVVFLASKGIAAQKIKAPAQATAGAEIAQWNITVEPTKVVEAMALLNQQGLPKKRGTTLLELFAKQGLMSSDKEENIRYQAGIEEELKNIIIKIDGIIDADVQISFPSAEIIPGAAPQKAKASVYIKHQGIFDNPNAHLETKIKRLLAGAVENLDFENVSIISDKAKLSNIELKTQAELISSKAREKEYVSIWSIIMTQKSAKKFRFIFFTFIALILVLGGLLGWFIYRFYPLIQKEKTKK